MEIEQLHSKIVYENPWMRVREDQVSRGDGSTGLFGVVEKPDFALIIPVDDEGDLWLVEQYRYPVGGRYWEFPQGSWETSANADAESLAKGELREETGITAGSMLHLGHLYEAYGYCDQGFDVCLATDLRVGDPERSTEEQDMTTRKVSRVEWTEMIASGRIKDAPSLAAFALLLMHDQS